MKPFLVELKTTIVVMADDMDGAMRCAASVASDACRDTPPHAVRCEPVSKLEDLREGWDGMCIPYGGDGNTRLRELFA